LRTVSMFLNEEPRAGLAGAGFWVCFA
jgi:hypothetical protein